MRHRSRLIPVCGSHVLFCRLLIRKFRRKAVLAGAAVFSCGDAEVADYNIQRKRHKDKRKCEAPANVFAPETDLLIAPDNRKDKGKQEFHSKRPPVDHIRSAIHYIAGSRQAQHHSRADDCKLQLSVSPQEKQCDHRRDADNRQAELGVIQRMVDKGHRIFQKLRIIFLLIEKRQAVRCGISRIALKLHQNRDQHRACCHRSRSGIAKKLQEPADRLFSVRSRDHPHQCIDRGHQCEHVEEIEVGQGRKPDGHKENTRLPLPQNLLNPQEQKRQVDHRGHEKRMQHSKIQHGPAENIAERTA